VTYKPRIRDLRHSPYEHLEHEDFLRLTAEPDWRLGQARLYYRRTGQLPAGFSREEIES
jgi:hypothetical protein